MEERKKGEGFHTGRHFFFPLQFLHFTNTLILGGKYETRYGRQNSLAIPLLALLLLLLWLTLTVSLMISCPAFLSLWIRSEWTNKYTRRQTQYQRLFCLQPE